MWYQVILVVQCISQSAKYVSSFKLMPGYVETQTVGTTNITAFNFLDQPRYHMLFPEPRTNSIQIRQYAPLHQYVRFPKAEISTTIAENIYKKIKKEPQEPRKAYGQNENTQCNNHNHQTENDNLGNFRSASRSPGHNAVYRIAPVLSSDSMLFNTRRTQGSLPNVQIISSVADKKIFNNVKYIKAPIINKNTQGIAETELPYYTDNIQNYMKPAVVKQPYLFRPNLPSKDYNSPLEARRQLLSPYNNHRIHLNIARVYSPGASQPLTKSEGYPDVYTFRDNQVIEELIAV